MTVETERNFGQSNRLQLTKTDSTNYVLLRMQSTNVYAKCGTASCIIT